jgi:hypothetical protein
MNEIPANAHTPYVLVWHSKLKRFNDSAYKSYKSYCPVCDDGILLIYRSMTDNFKLARKDCCISCGQTVIYLDESVNSEFFED